jgi:predicted esterase
MFRLSLTLFLMTLFVISCSSISHKDSDKQVKFEIDVIYGHSHGMAMTLDVIKPANPNGAGVILTNSGGWRSPNDSYKLLDSGQYRLASNEELYALGMWPILNPKVLVDNGYTVFEVRHGSGTKFDMPELVQHVRRAIRFIKYYAKDYGVDSNRIGLWGGSASGHLSLLIGTSPEIGLKDANDEWEMAKSSVSSIVVFASPTNLSQFVNDNPATKDYFRVLYLTEDQYTEFSPITYVSSDDPPTLVMHGNTDDVIPIKHGQAIFDALQNAGVASEYIEFDNTSHIPTLEQSKRGVDEALKWFDKYLND